MRSKRASAAYTSEGLPGKSRRFGKLVRASLAAGRCRHGERRVVNHVRGDAEGGLRRRLHAVLQPRAPQRNRGGSRRCTRRTVRQHGGRPSAPPSSFCQESREQRAESREPCSKLATSPPPHTRTHTHSYLSMRHAPSVARSLAASRSPGERAHDRAAVGQGSAYGGGGVRAARCGPHPLITPRAGLASDRRATGARTRVRQPPDRALPQGITTRHAARTRRSRSSSWRRGRRRPT